MKTFDAFATNCLHVKETTRFDILTKLGLLGIDWVIGKEIILSVIEEIDADVKQHGSLEAVWHNKD